MATNDIDRASKVIELLNQEGFEAYIIGGTVRDILLGLDSHDMDIATASPPLVTEWVLQNSGYKVVRTGVKYGTVSIRESPEEQFMEVTTFRSEGRYTDNRHPDKVTWETDVLKDLSRRDFTINAIAYNPLTDEYVDPFNGIKDIKEMRLQTVGNPYERFYEDPLRMLRLCRFAGRFHFLIENPSIDACCNLAFALKYIAVERIRDELYKVMQIEEVDLPFAYMHDFCVLENILPEVDVLWGITQPPSYHKYDVFEHTMRTVNEISVENPLLRFAALFHDLGKVDKNHEPPPYFPDHESRSVELTDGICDRWNLANYQREYLLTLVGHHMDCLGHTYVVMTEKGIKRYINKFPNLDMLFDLFKLQRADIAATGMFPDVQGFIDEVDFMEERVWEILKKEPPMKVTDLKIDGYDLMDMGMEPGPIFSTILSTLLEEVIDDPEKNNKEYLLKRSKEIASEI
jgi:tRNA nucleotidyltransferase (CCA-adding enzyme)